MPQQGKRNADHQLLLALALAAWVGEQWTPPPAPVLIPTPRVSPSERLRPRHDSAQRRRGLFGRG